LLRLEKTGASSPTFNFWPKAEWFNPGGSVKDRPALSMIQAGLASGALRPGKTIIDATSGNTGIAYAMIGAAMGYPVALCCQTAPRTSASVSWQPLARRMITTPGDEGTDGAIRACRKLWPQIRINIFIPISYSNPANWQAHYFGTANEIGSKPPAASLILLPG